MNCAIFRLNPVIVHANSSYVYDILGTCMFTCCCAGYISSLLGNPSKIVFLVHCHGVLQWRTFPRSVANGLKPDWPMLSGLPLVSRSFPTERYS